MRGLRYIALAGIGWLIDFGLFSAAVALFGAPEAAANFASAMTAAALVYAAARIIVFRSSVWRWAPAALYLAYTAANICVWSLAIQVLTQFMLTHGWMSGAAYAAMAAKILLTPFSLATNYFVVARLSADRPQKIYV